MRLRIWIAVLAAVLLAIGMPTAAQETQKRGEIVFPVKIVSEPAKSAEDIAAEKASQKHEADDLVAQQSVANSTVYIVWVSIAQLVLAIAGTGVLLYTIGLNRKATDAAVKAVDATVNVGRDQSRAYVHLERAEFRIRPDNPYGPTLTLVVKNSGQTPAKWFELQYDTFILTVHDDDKRLDEIDFVIEPKLYHPIGADVEIPVDAMFLVSEEIQAAYRGDDFERGAHMLFLAGRIRYATFFDELFVTEFMYELRTLPDYAVDIVGQSPQGPQYAEVPHNMVQSAGSFRAFERIEA